MLVSVHVSRRLNGLPPLTWTIWSARSSRTVSEFIDSRFVLCFFMIVAFLRASRQLQEFPATVGLLQLQTVSHGLPLPPALWRPPLTSRCASVSLLISSGLFVRIFFLFTFTLLGLSLIHI